MDMVLKFLKKIGRQVQVVAVVDLGWGDGGKGKMVDWLSGWADIIARGTGGANAGHTIKLGQETNIFHLVPSGILRDGDGKFNLIGRGVAVDPGTLAGELSALQKAGKTYNGLRVSHQAHLVLPIDVALDRLKEAARVSTIGTTGRGIGPAYESYVARIGLKVNDLLNPDALAQKLLRNWEDRRGFLRQFDQDLVTDIMHLPALGGGALYAGPEKIFNLDAIIEQYLFDAKMFSELIVDTDELLHNALSNGQKALLEGAQGILLSVDRGSYPYVTSSDCSLDGLVSGVGLQVDDVDHTLSISKAPYMTRVGRGPFPTEMGGAHSAHWCGLQDMHRERERYEYPNPSLNSDNEFEQGIAIRQAGNEYGATTGRLRRVGWWDVPLMRHAIKYGGLGQGGLALTMLDVVNGCQTIKVCTHHRYIGEDGYRVGSLRLTRGMLLKTAIMDEHVLANCQPVYQELPGWDNLDDIRVIQPLIDTIEESVGTTVDVVSVGADRDATIVL